MLVNNCKYLMCIQSNDYLCLALLPSAILLICTPQYTAILELLICCFSHMVWLKSRAFWYDMIKLPSFFYSILNIVQCLHINSKQQSTRICKHLICRYSSNSFLALSRSFRTFYLFCLPSVEKLHDAKA